MKTCKKLVMLAAATACLAGAQPALAAPTALFDTSITSIAFASPIAAVYGDGFTMTSTVTATALGLYDYLGDGFAEAHQVGLLNAAGALLASASFGPGQAGSLRPGVQPGANPLQNSAMRYLDITDVLLEAGHTYWLAATFPAPLHDGLGMTLSVTSSYASGFSGAYSFGSDLGLPSFPLGSVVGVNLLIADTAGTGGNSVPEPASAVLVLTLLGGLALSRRQRGAT